MSRPTRNTKKSAAQSPFKDEHEFSRWWGTMLTEVNALVTPLVAGMRQVPGLPDRHVAHRELKPYGGQVWVESKLGDRALTTAQRLRMRRLCERGACAVVLRSTGNFVRVESWSGELLAEYHAGDLSGLTLLQGLRTACALLSHELDETHALSDE